VNIHSSTKTKSSLGRIEHTGLTWLQHRYSNRTLECSVNMAISERKQIFEIGPACTVTCRPWRSSRVIQTRLRNWATTCHESAYSSSPSRSLAYSAIECSEGDRDLPPLSAAADHLSWNQRCLDAVKVKKMLIEDVSSIISSKWTQNLTSLQTE